MLKMSREQMEHIDHKLYHKQHILFKAFLVNIILMLLVWLLCKSGLMEGVHAGSGLPAEFMTFQWMGWMAIWKIANIVLFFVPAVAIWWERKCIEHHEYNRNREEKPMRRR